MWWLVGAVLMFAVMCLSWYKLGVSVGKNRAQAIFARRKPVCGCKHHISYHLQPDTTVSRSRYGRYGCANCACARYVGPLPSDGDVILGMSSEDQLQLLGMVDNTGGEG